MVALLWKCVPSNLHFHEEAIMPKILQQENLPGCKSAAVLFFTGSRQEDIHLFYSYNREHGPGIIREGTGPARMGRIYKPYGYTQDPVEQRVGTLFIDSDLQQRFLDSQDFKKLKSLEAQKIIKHTSDYISDSEFDASLRQNKNNCIKSSKPQLIGLQSFGDLTMNLWNVAFVRLPTGEPKLIYLSDEKINDRVYSCVVKWKPGNTLNKPAVTIDFLRFSSFIDSKDPGVVRLAESDKPIADQIEFAASGQQVIRDGNVVKAQEIVDQFADVRHLLALPNLNPNGPLYSDLTNQLDLDSGRPRFYFGRKQEFDLWFGEAPLLQYRNTRRAAVNGVIELNRLESGASMEQVRAALSFQLIKVDNQNKPDPLYREITTPTQPLKRGEWRFVPEDSQWIDIWLKPNIYPSNILGVTKKGDVICFAWSGSYTNAPGHTLIEDLDSKLYGHRIESATTMLQRVGNAYGLKDAILLDEGSDVRLEAFNDDDNPPKWQKLVGKQREQVRAMFLYSKKK